MKSPTYRRLCRRSATWVPETGSSRPGSRADSSLSDKPKRLGYLSPMPTILRLGGLRIVIYPNDHPPAHVHVIGPGWEVVIDVVRLELREAIGCTERDARQTLRLVAEHRDDLLEAWRRIHD
ncbi:DUF4160 domain-containing protein [Methylosinus sp. Sm6]|uniref:DUF4160 domain-containing protein n=1 Tax=Methylosinus sp. Sm6 TaxID=2866948 RepID=UPI00351D2D61